MSTSSKCKIMMIAVGLLLAAGAGFIIRGMVYAINDNPVPGDNARRITDAAGREVIIPEVVEHMICSGAGALRLLTYLNAQEKAVGVDCIEKRTSAIDARPYAIANPQFADLPLFGEFRGYDNPERILSLNPAPQVILRTEMAGGDPPDRLERKTGIPVVVVRYGNLINARSDLDQALRIAGAVVGREQRAEEIIDFFDNMVDDLGKRTSPQTGSAGPTCYVGGIAMRGPHGFHSTEPRYPPFEFTGADNVAGALADGSRISHAMVAREKLIEWDPEVVFLDLSTIWLGDGAGALHEIRTERAYRNLQAVRQGRVYGVIPYNSYHANFGSIFANAYFVGSVLYPDGFSDVDPVAKADEIYRFLLGDSVFREMNAAFGGRLFEQLGRENIDSF